MEETTATKRKRTQTTTATTRKTQTDDVLTLKVKRLSSDAKLPEQQTVGAVGLDLYVKDTYRIHPVGTCLAPRATKVGTGIAVEIPQGYHGKIFLRSSTGATRSLRLANGTGIIDSDYRGEVMLLVENIGQQPELLNDGERIAQLLIEKSEQVVIQEVEELNKTERGVGGLGSTGK